MVSIFHDIVWLLNFYRDWKMHPMVISSKKIFFFVIVVLLLSTTVAVVRSFHMIRKDVGRICSTAQAQYAGKSKVEALIEVMKSDDQLQR
jgi:hypothetical protein